MVRHVQDYIDIAHKGEAEVYREQRQGAERFVDTVERIGLAPFKARVYPPQEARA